MKDVSVYKRKDSPCWWIAFWCPRRLKRVAESSGERTDDPLGHKRALTKAREKSHDAAAGKSEAGVARWEVWVTPWLQLKHGNKPLSLEAETTRWQWLQLFLHERQCFVPGAVTYQLGLDYLTWRKDQAKRSGKKPSHNTALQELRLLGRVMRAAVQRGFIVASPLERMGIKEESAPEKSEISDADIALIRAELAKLEGSLPLQDQWMTTCFEIALHQGCRLQETSVPLDRIDEVRRTITFLQKGARWYTTRLHDSLVPRIAALRAAGATVTCTLPKGKLASKYWHWFFKGRKDKGHESAGVAPHLTFHCTRVTVITRMARAGVPIQQAMAYVGHADESIHRIYQRLKAPDLEKCTEALSF